MKKILIIAIALCFNGATALLAEGYSVPVRAVFASQMMPRFVGVSSIHGHEIGLSEKDSDIVSEIRGTIIALLKPKMKRVKELESKVFDLSLQKGTYEQIVPLLEEIAKVKLEASLVQLKCIEIYKDKVSDEDFEKVKAFLKTKKKDIFEHVNII
ncbi:MAG: hypothetical protein U9Q29_03785 [Campylobacterota bacterium]|nr:hypothetical protein [Campylobacterota bacterium]